MAKKQIKHKPLNNSEYKIIVETHPLIRLILFTGARIAEIHRIINQYDNKSEYIDILTKKSKGVTNRIFLNEKAIKQINELEHLKGKTVRTLQRIVEKISVDNNIKFSSHNLRATFATRLLENGADLVSVQHLMNHSDISITAQYIKFNESKLRTTSELVYNTITKDGYTLPEAIGEINKLRIKIARLEQSFKGI